MSSEVSRRALIAALVVQVFTENSMAAAASGEDVVVVGGVRLRTKYGSFFRGGVTDNEKENPGLGSTVAYHGEAIGEATVYVYDKGLSEIPDGPGSEAVRGEFDTATRDVLSSVQYFHGRKVELVDRYGTGAPDRGRELLCAEFVVTDSAGSRRSFVYLTGASRKFVKIRVTLRKNDPTDPSARDFADAVASELWRR